VNTSQGKNTTQWCKQEACWDGLKKADYKFPDTLNKLLVPLGANPQTAVQESSKEDQDLIAAIAGVDAEIWLSISSWGKQTQALQPFQNGISYTLGTYKGRNKQPSIKQAKQGIIILKTAVEKGFIQNPAIAELVAKFA
jgi:hypothetical protein